MDDALLARAQQRLASERLPTAAGTRTWAAHGDGTRSCEVCGAGVAPGHLEMRIEWDVGTGTRGAVLHLSCFGAWRAAVNPAAVPPPRERRVRR